ncbi:hypothetical protein LCGC14_2176240, partial [marine sediment metagenome]
ARWRTDSDSSTQNRKGAKKALRKKIRRLKWGAEPVLSPEAEVPEAADSEEVLGLPITPEEEAAAIKTLEAQGIKKPEAYKPITEVPKPSLLDLATVELPDPPKTVPFGPILPETPKTMVVEIDPALYVSDSGLRQEWDGRLRRS